MILLWGAWGQLQAAESVNSLVEAGQYQQAYELALPLVADRAGEPQFDFDYGMAALETGRPQEAAFAFERVLAMEPRDHRARLELARAHLLMGNYEQSQSLFFEVLASEPPPLVRENIQNFLDELDSRLKKRSQSFSAMVDLKMGADSNVNSATQVSSVDTLAFGPVSLDETSRELSDSFAELGLRSNYIKLLNKKAGVFVSGSLFDRHNEDYNQFDIRSLGINAGFLYKARHRLIRIPLQWQMLEVGRAAFRRSNGIGLEWGEEFNSDQQLTAFLQWSRLRYVESQTLRDGDSMILGVGWNASLNSIQTKVSAGIYFSDESPENVLGSHFGRELLGYRLSGEWHGKKDHEFTLSWSVQAVEHDSVHTTFGKVRDDDFSSLSFEWQWQIEPSWRVGFVSAYMDNSSNLNIYTYKRKQNYVSVRYTY